MRTSQTSTISNPKPIIKNVKTMRGNHGSMVTPTTQTQAIQATPIIRSSSATSINNLVDQNLVLSKREVNQPTAAPVYIKFSPGQLIPPRQLYKNIQVPLAQQNHKNILVPLSQQLKINSKIIPTSAPLHQISVNCPWTPNSTNNYVLKPKNTADFPKFSIASYNDKENNIENSANAA